jgi:DNA-binding NarL/FixJ family response regulator
MTKLVIADSHRMFADCLQKVFNKQYFEVVAWARDGIEAVSMAVEHHPQILLMELTLPRMNGLEVAREVQRAVPSVRSVLLTTRSDETCLREAFQLGIRGYILKHEPFAELESALRKISGGELYISDRLVSGLVLSWTQNGKALNDVRGLSLRESQVLKLIAEGHSTKQAAGLLAISPKTFDSHRGRLMAKLGVHEIAGLVRYAVQHGVVSEG